MDEIFALGNWHAIVDACTEFSPQDDHTCESISYFRDKIEIWVGPLKNILCFELNLDNLTLKCSTRLCMLEK
jgi:hypothetical protein